MSVIAINRISPSIVERAHAVLQRLFPAEETTGRLYKDVKDLPDHLLLDIGIDPRHTPLSLHEVIARPDLVHGGVVTSGFRTVAKS